VCVLAGRVVAHAPVRLLVATVPSVTLEAATSSRASVVAIENARVKTELGRPTPPGLEAVVPIVAMGLGMLVFNVLVLLVTRARARMRRPLISSAA
jgi:hypothetical protein